MPNILIINSYAVKHLKSGAARVYITDQMGLESAGLSENVKFEAQYGHNRITVKPSVSGGNTIMNTGRGLLLELKNKSTAKSLRGISRVSVTFDQNGVIIGLNHSEQQKLDREMDLIEAVGQGIPLRMASFCSGLGSLSYHLKVGMAAAGVRTSMTFANDANERAMSINLAGNPIWETATDDAVAVVDKLENLDLNILPNSSIVEIGYPCVGMTSLCRPENRDTNHPVSGTLYIPLLAALKKMNPSIVVFENAPFFINSETLALIKKEMTDYRFEHYIANAYDFGEIETRKRACVIAISDGLPELELHKLVPPVITDRPMLGSYLEDIPLDSQKWRKMEHIKRKDKELNHNYKNKVHLPTDTQIGTLIASYAAPKAGSPMIQHPLDSQLQRQFEPPEHGRIRQLPKKVYDLVMKVADGRHPLVSKCGSRTAAHELMGNGVSKWVWTVTGEFLGNYLIEKVRPLYGELVEGS